MSNIHYLVPEQTQGLEKDIVYLVTARDTEDAEDWFVDAKERLLDINYWGKHSHLEAVEFKLIDGHNKFVKRNAHRGDHIQIDNVSQNLSAINGFDWVVIEAIEYDDYPDIDMEAFALRLRSTLSPEEKALNGGQENSCASSTFVIERRGHHLQASYHGRNELAVMPVLAADEDIDQAGPEAWMGLSDNMLNSILKGFMG